jgi:ribosomal protein L37AE/L43A
MIIETTMKKITYKCDDCFQVKTINFRKERLDQKIHRCRSCQAKKASPLGAQAIKIYASPGGKLFEKFQKIGLALNDWQIANDFKKIAARAAVAAGAPSKAGKIGGRKTADSGKLAETSRIISKRLEVKQKIFHTKKKKGLLRQSKIELNFLAELQKMFPGKEIKHHVTLKEYQIDFLIENKIYVEFDGVYWHGLDRPYDQLGFDQRKKFDRDRRLEEFCKTYDICLIRITDVEFKSQDWKKKFEGVL